MTKLLSFNDAKKYLNVSRATLYRIIQGKKIPAVKVGGQWRFKQERLSEWLDENEVIKNT